jgi:hypothetical protein
VKIQLSAFVTASQDAFALLLYQNGYEEWLWDVVRYVFIL